VALSRITCSLQVFLSSHRPLVGASITRKSGTRMSCASVLDFCVYESLVLTCLGLGCSDRKSGQSW
jgi:hypothetical protein